MTREKLGEKSAIIAALIFFAWLMVSRTSSPSSSAIKAAIVFGITALVGVFDVTAAFVVASSVGFGTFAGQYVQVRLAGKSVIGAPPKVPVKLADVVSSIRSSQSNTCSTSGSSKQTDPTARDLLDALSALETSIRAVKAAGKNLEHLLPECVTVLEKVFWVAQHDSTVSSADSARLLGKVSDLTVLLFSDYFDAGFLRSSHVSPRSLQQLYKAQYKCCSKQCSYSMRLITGAHLKLNVVNRVNVKGKCATCNGNVSGYAGKDLVANLTF